MAWLEPIMWRFQSWLYSKRVVRNGSEARLICRTLLTLCPSPSTLHMLEGQFFGGIRLWPRGVDLSQFGRHRRSAAMRASWGVGAASSPVPIKMASVESQEVGTHWRGRQASLPLTPPLTPWTGPVDQITTPPPASQLPTRVVLLYVGRISWEKNLHLFLAAYAKLGFHLANQGAEMPRMVFVGDGPAKAELEAICGKNSYDAIFMGHRSGQELAECYASADVFAFPSFTEVRSFSYSHELDADIPDIRPGCA
jgi:glycosyltransferase involved in cell wall biosynthesis